MPRTNFDDPSREPSLADTWIQEGFEHRRRQNARLDAAQVVARWLAHKMQDHRVHEPSGQTYSEAAKIVSNGLRQAIMFGVYPTGEMLGPIEVKDRTVKLKGKRDDEQASFVLVLKVREGISDGDLLNFPSDESLMQLWALDKVTEPHPLRIPDTRRLVLADPCLGPFPDIQLPAA